MILYLRQTSLLYMTKRFYTLYTNRIKQIDNIWNYLMENYKNVLVEPNNTSKEIWKNIRNYIESECNSFSIIDSFILNIFYSKNHPNVGIYYYKFLEENNYNPTIHTIIKYLQLYHLKKDLITKIEEKHILSLCKKIMTQYSSFNVNIGNTLVKSFCQVNQWNDAVKVIEKYEENNDNMLCEGYNILIECLFDHKQDKLAYKYLINSMKKQMGSNEHICITYLKYCLKEKHTFNEKIEKIFTLWNTYGVKPTQKVAVEYMTACIEHDWTANQTTILNLKCQNCKKYLSQTNISDQDYKCLLEAIKKKFEPANMYYTSFPKEIENFMMFIEKNKPFDIIIDGLNFIYTTERNKTLDCKIIELLKFFGNQNKKILIIGRKHMSNFFENLNIKEIHHFLVKNWSHDDLFLLYAAFSTGRNAIIISKDLMRQHKFAIQNTELNILFNKWQFLHQYYFDKYKGLIKLNSEVPIDAFVQKHDDHWHIPFNINVGAHKQRHIWPNYWICLKMPK